MKLQRHSLQGTYRLLMRREQVLKVLTPSPLSIVPLTKVIVPLPLTGAHFILCWFLEGLFLELYFSIWNFVI